MPALGDELMRDIRDLSDISVLQMLCHLVKAPSGALNKCIKHLFDKFFITICEAKEVFDVTGAGDAVISTFTLSLTAGANKRQAAEISNFAAGVVVGKLGAVAVTKEELLIAIKGYSVCVS